MLTVIVLTVLVPWLGGAAAVADTSMSAAERLPLAIAPALATGFLIVSVALAVYKPRWRVRGDRPMSPRNRVPNLEEYTRRDTRHIQRMFADVFSGLQPKRLGPPIPAADWYNLDGEQSASSRTIFDTSDDAHAPSLNPNIDTYW